MHTLLSWPPTPAQQELVKWAIACATAVFAVWKWSAQRRDELRQRHNEWRWKRLEFIFEQNDRFEENPHVRSFLRLLSDGKRGDTLLRRSLRETHDESLSDDEFAVRQDVDFFMQFFLRMSYSVDASVARLDDILLFGWYFGLIRNNEALAEYAVRCGFHDLLIMHERLVGRQATLFWSLGRKARRCLKSLQDEVDQRRPPPVDGRTAISTKVPEPLRR